MKARRFYADLHGKCGSCEWAEPLADTAYVRCRNTKMNVRRRCMGLLTADIKKRTNKACKKFYKSMEEYND